MVGYADRPTPAAAASNTYLQQMGLTLGAIGLARAYLVAKAARTEDADGLDSGFYAAQQYSAHVYYTHILPQVYVCAAQIENVQALLGVSSGCFGRGEAVQNLSESGRAAIRSSLATDGPHQGLVLPVFVNFPKMSR